jgi:glycosyltransferase involved in cell wall biosynthesis
VTKVSAVIPTHDRWPMVAEAVSSALQQSPACEVIVADDGSSDGTVEHLRSRFGDAIEVLALAHGGRSVARNQGVAHASGELVAFLDSDDVWLPGKLAKQSALFAEDPGAAISAGEALITDMDLNVSESLTAAHRRFAGEFAREGCGMEAIARRCPIFTSTVMVRRDVFLEVGGFDTSLDIYEDLDLYARLCTRGDIAWTPEPLSKQRRHEGRTGGTEFVLAEDEFARRQLARARHGEYVASRRTVARLNDRQLFAAYATRDYRRAFSKGIAAATTWPPVMREREWWRPMAATAASALLRR